MILLTGASGPTGSVMLKHFAKRGLKVRAFVNRPESAEKALKAGAAEAIAGDINRREDVRRAMAGCDQVYFVAPRFFETEIAIGGWMIEAAREQGMRQFIYHSVLHAQVDGLPHHRDKRVVEGMIMESLLPYTILQPTQYFQVSTRDWKGIATTGEFSTPFGADQKLAVADLEDIAEAAAITASQPGWTGGCFELMSGDSYTRHEMAAIMSEALGKPVKAVVEDVGHWRAHQKKTGAFSDSQIARAEKMFEHYSSHGLSGGNGRVLEMILGRKPTAYRDYVMRLGKERPNG